MSQLWQNPIDDGRFAVRWHRYQQAGRSGARYTPDRILDPGKGVLGLDGWVYFASNFDALALRLNGAGQVIELRRCATIKTLTDSPCDAALRIAEGALFFPLPRDGDGKAEAARYQALFESWRCPAAPGCANRD